MDFGGLVFFGFLAAVIIVPQVLRNQERQRLHDTIRASLAKGQPVPPELWQALRWRRRVYAADYDAYPGAYAPPPPPPGPPPAGGAPYGTEAPFVEPTPVAGEPYGTPSSPPLFVGRSLVERDLRRGVVWLAIGVGLIAAGAAFYAGLYEDGGAPEVFSSFAALGAIPVFVGLTYLALWGFGRKRKA